MSSGKRRNGAAGLLNFWFVAVLLFDAAVSSPAFADSLQEDQGFDALVGTWIHSEYDGLFRVNGGGVLDGKPRLRVVVDEAIERRKLYGKRTILFIDEVHRWNKAQQDALLPHVENGTITLIGATTENPYFEVIGALVSRSRVLALRVAA